MKDILCCQYVFHQRFFHIKRLKNLPVLNLQFDANYSISTTTPSLISTTIMPILNSTALSNQTSALNTTVQNVTNSFSSASSEYFNRFILEIHKSDGIHDLGIIKWEMASKKNTDNSKSDGRF